MKNKEIVTLGELKMQIESTIGKELPTAYALIHSGVDVVVQKEFDDKSTLCVYKNGFALYRNKLHNTVFRVDRCGGYTYFTRRGELTYCEDYFDDQNWAVRLLIEAEDRIKHNIDANESQFHVKDCGGRIDEVEQGQTLEEYLEAKIRTEMIEKIISQLTPKQKKYLYLYILEEVCISQIAKKYGVAVNTVSKSIISAKKKIKKLLDEQG